MFTLAEAWGLPYADAMALPWSRRQRLIDAKADLERQRAAAMRSGGGRARRGR